VTNAVARDQTDSNGAVNDGDQVQISANVTDNSGTGISSVTADASDFGAGTVTLTDGNSDGVYDATFNVDEASASSDGTYAIEITAADNNGGSGSAFTNELTLDTTAPNFNDLEATTSSDNNIKSVTYNWNASDATTVARVNFTVVGGRTVTQTVTTSPESGSEVVNLQGNEKAQNVDIYARVVDEQGNYQLCEVTSVGSGQTVSKSNGDFTCSDGTL
jgi:hypothetical protein